jgi:hypothetical protein
MLMKKNCSGQWISNIPDDVVLRGPNVFESNSSDIKLHTAPSANRNRNYISFDE